MRPAKEFRDQGGFESMKWSHMNPSRLTREEACVHASVMHWVIPLQHAGGWDMMRQGTFFPINTTALATSRMAEYRTNAQRQTLVVFTWMHGGVRMLIEEAFNNKSIYVFHPVDSVEIEASIFHTMNKTQESYENLLKKQIQEPYWIWSEHVQLWFIRHPGSNGGVTSCWR